MITYDPTVRNRYAEALFNVAKRQNVCQDWMDEATELVEALNSTPRSMVFLQGPQFTTEAKRGFLDRTLKGKFSAPIERLIYILLEKGRIAYLSPILERFVVLARLEMGFREGEVTTAVELSDDQKSVLQRKLEDYVAGKLTIKYTVDANALGGVRFRCGDLLLDDTVAWRLECMRRTLETAARRVDAA